jgi:hypothetical protein
LATGAYSKHTHTQLLLILSSLFYLILFTKERDAAIQLAEEGKTSDNEQLVWVLWKVLKGDGDSDHVRGRIRCSMAACEA